jgi:SAM-dependent methyltransferase
MSAENETMTQDVATSRHFDELEVIERESNVTRAREWLVPILGQLGIDKTRKILNVGCGYGTDVMYLRKLGWDCYGADPGARTERWGSDTEGILFTVAGEELPFSDKTFDFAVSFEVMEHVGTQPPYYFDPLPDHQRLRQKFADELVRVTRDAILITTPNKWFPLDFWHKAERWGARFHSPFEKFTVSVRDLRKLFRPHPVIHAPLSGYFRFELSKRVSWRRQLVSVTRSMFALGDSSFGLWMRPFAPTLGVLVCLNEKTRGAAQRLAKRGSNGDTK